MPESVLVAAIGRTVRIDVSDLSMDAVSAVRSAWRDAQSPVIESEELLPTVVPTASLSLDRLLADLSQRVTLAAIEAARGGPWMLHAAGIATDDGRVVVLVGRSGSGKTTAARMLAAECGYVSDETVAIAPDGEVLPYRKPLSIIEAPGEPKVQRAPSDLRLRPLPDAPLRLGAIVLLDRREDAPAEPLVEPVDLGDALPELVAQTSYLPDLDRPLQTIAMHAAAVGGIRRVTYREAASLVPLIPQLIAEPESTGAPRRVVERGEAESKRTAADGSTPGFVRTPAVDALDLADPDRVAVLHLDEAGAGTVRVLAGIAPTLWRHVDGATLADLTAVAVAEHGTPEGADAEAAVRAALDELVASGVIAHQAPAWRIRDDVAWTGDGDRVIVLSLADPAAQPQAMQGAAALIWLALADGPADLDALIDRVAAAAQVDSTTVHDDVERFLEHLRAVALADQDRREAVRPVGASSSATGV